MTASRLAIASLLVSLAAAAGCAAPEPASASASESDVVVRKLVELETFVVGKSGSRSEALASFQAACAAWGDAQRAIAGARFVDVKCPAEPESMMSSSSLFGGKATARFTVEVEETTKPFESAGATVFETEPNLSESFAAISKACDAELAKAKALYGDRLLGGGCDAPKDYSTGSNVLGATFKTLVMPAGLETSVDLSIVGKLGGLDEALASWKTACEAWVAEVRLVAGARLLGADCGTPIKDAEASSSTKFVSKAKLHVGSGDDGKLAPVASGGARTIGAMKANLVDADQDWQHECSASLAFAGELLGDRLLGGGCGERTNASTTARLFTSSTPMAVKAAGATKVVAIGYALGEPLNNLDAALDSFGDAAKKALRASVERTGAARVEGFEVGEATNHSSSSRLYGAPTKLLIGVDIAEGGLPPETTTVTVKGPSGNIDAAAKGWNEACEAEAAKAKITYGDRFVAAACGEPRHPASAFESDLTIWLLP